MHVNLLQNTSLENMVTPPGVTFSKSQEVVKRHLMCDGRGRIEKFAVIAQPKDTDGVDLSDCNQ